MRLDVGFHLSTALRFRLLGVDTPERGQRGWAEASEFTRAWLAEQPDLTVYTCKSDSFGRWLADVVREDGSSLSAALMESGHAQPYTR